MSRRFCFRHLLERHQLTAQMFAAVRDLLEEHDLPLTSGAIVDATLIAAPQQWSALPTPC